MRKLLMLSVVAIMTTAGAAGCNSCGNTCGNPCGRSSCGWLTAWRPRHQDCCAPAPCGCNACGGGSMGASYMGAGMMDGAPSGAMMMPSQSCGCQ